MSKNYLEQLQIAEQHKAANQDYDLPRIELFTCPLETLAGMVECLGPDCEQYMKTNELLQIIQQGLMSKNPSSRRVTFALLSVMIEPLPHILQEHMPKIIPLALDEKNLTPHNARLFMNASYLVGQTCNVCPQMLQPFLEPCIKNLAQVITMPKAPPMMVPNGTEVGPTYMTYCSASFTLARVAHQFGQQVSQVFPQFAVEWTYHLGRVTEDEEKKFAFGVLMQQLQQNPQPYLNNPAGIGILCEAIGSWWEPPSELHQTFTEVVHTFKKAYEQQGGNWENIMNQMSEEVVSSFRRRHHC